jgi:molybdate/tungstate transport system ATP-binding protein
MLKLEKICKKAGAFALTDIDLDVGMGDYFFLIGQSGSGKTMILEIIAGILKPDSGDLIFNERNIADLPPQKRNIGIVYQKPSLFPHMSVYENIAYPLKIRKYSKKLITEKINILAEDTEVSHILNRRTGNLSGGEIQRVSLARTLATDPEILLLDEPFSSLDVQLKRGLMSLLRKLNQKNQTIIQVTHDYEEALALAGKVAIIENGQIIQTGFPLEIFTNPISQFVADFIGISNFFRGKISDSAQIDGIRSFETSGLSILINTSEQMGPTGYLMIPPDSITLSEEKLNSSALNNFSGTVTDIYRTKSGIEVKVNIGIELTAKISDYSLKRLNIEIEKSVWISFKANSVHFVRN